ncbi:biofilm development regulator YmgB/AriR family protein [Escherichia sp. ESNIH1]|uniref:biofilm development regulator YmgB/AriR family protein n=1 Tax=Escherichia sp. ESNIH1 TaxID=1985876 RepID=UPI00112FA464|nr:biofilm development regulator YmgB/AriR family protein [Escherichia sp. ESNIH1]
MCDKDVKHAHDYNVSADVRAVMQSVPSREEMLGDIVIALLRAGQIISRRTICLKLVSRIESETDPIVAAHLSDLMRLILRNNRS